MAGVRAGYGLGIFSRIDVPFHVLGHLGGIDGYLSAYGYSPSRDVGYVVLLNSTHAPEALTRLSSLAIRYLKRNVEAPPKETIDVAEAVLQSYTGYYHDANPRHALLEPVTFPLGGRTIRVRDGRLVMSTLLEPAATLVPVNDRLFRREDELTASLAFTDARGVAVLAGPAVYAERRARWPIDLLRVALGLALALGAAAPLAAIGRGWWRRRRGWGPARGLGVAWTLAVLAFAGFFGLAATAPVVDLAVPSMRTWAMFVCSLAHPLVAFALLPLTALAWARGVGRVFGTFAALVAAAHVGLAGYLGWWGLVGFRSWAY
jgi:hypothetical protein